MKRALHFVANLLAAVVTVLLLIDPARPRGPVFVLLAHAAVFALAPRLLR